MGKKIDVNDFIDKEYINKIGERYRVIQYLFKEKNNHCFDIQFIITKNKQMATLNQIRNRTCIDLIERKKQKRLDTEKKLKERNKLIAKTKKTYEIPKNINELNVLAIDLSTTSTGIAYSQKGKIVRWKTIKPFDSLDFRDRALHIINEIVDILKTGKIELVLLEDIYLGLNSKILIMLSEIRGMLTYHIQKLNIELSLVPAIFWKSRTGENLPFERKEQKKYMIQKFKELTKEQADSDDVADAYMMLYACLKN